MRGWAIALGLALAAGCSGGDDDSEESRTTTPVTEATTVPAPSTTTEAEPTTTTTVPLYSFDGSVPPPPLVNTGTDYEAIYRSLDAYQHWLYGHNPDPQLIDEIVVPGTSIYAAYERDVGILIDNDARDYDTASVVTGVEVTAEEPSAVTLLVEYTDDRKVIIGRDGNVIDEAQLQSPSRSIVVLTVDATGRWRVAASENATPEEVEL
ncbi:MAG: hypothetical protein ACT4OX_13640 [Actinomycetota bacterium]